VTFIRRCRDFGYSIDQVRLLAGLSLSADRDCIEVRDIAQEHLGKVRERHALEKSLDGFVDQCEVACAGGPGCDCVFKDLARPATPCC